jgi:hypothetical protein
MHHLTKDQNNPVNKRTKIRYAPPDKGSNPQLKKNEIRMTFQNAHTNSKYAHKVHLKYTCHHEKRMLTQTDMRHLSQG